MITWRNFSCWVQGNCSGPPPPRPVPGAGLAGGERTLPLAPPVDVARRQCVVAVREDFLETTLSNTVLWLSNLYITLPGVEKNHTTLVSVREGADAYLTGMTFVADGEKARVIDVNEDSRLFVAGARALTASYMGHLLHAYAL